MSKGDNMKGLKTWNLLLQYVREGQIYKHFKGGVYTVDGLYLDEETETVMVAYKDKDGNPFVRKADVFLGRVLNDEGALVDRFRFIGSD